MPADRHTSMRHCHTHLLTALTAEMAHRPAATGLEWIDRERDALTTAANGWATAHPGCVTVTVTDVETIEHHAVGHVDYARKLAWYVTELIYQQ